MGIAAKADQTDFYIADNVLEGRLAWPHVYADDAGAHASDDGISVQGFGHVVAHNRISGYGDAVKTSEDGARAVDFYGNDVLYTYDNGIELDGSAGNSRCFRNRFTNTWDAISVQPILGGPAYIFQNVVVNAADEQMKFHALGTTPPTEPNGVLAYQNTFVSPKIDLNLCTPNTSHHFWIENNLFIGPAALAGKAVMWCGPVDDGHFDYNGYWPDGPFSLNLPSGAGYAYANWSDFAAMQASGRLETHGLLLSGLIFNSGLIGPSTYTIQMPPADVALASGSSAIDRGLVLPNINDGYTGAAPDLGALERGCATPIYGPRPVGTDESNEPFGCEGSGSIAPPQVSISLTPASATLSGGQTQTFTPTITGSSDTGVTWTINPQNIGGFTNGSYTAPATIAAAQNLTVTATSNADPTKSATASITLKPNAAPAVSIALSPAAVNLSANQSQTFTPTVTGASDTSVTWSVSPSNVGSFSAGTYTAPATISSAQTITITATSHADPSKSASATVTLKPAAPVPPPAGVFTIGPSVVLLKPSMQTAQFTVSGGQSATWSITPQTGQISASGADTAPAHTAAVWVKVVATSVANPKVTASAYVYVYAR
jgi:hypothetical protein